MIRLIKTFIGVIFFVALIVATFGLVVVALPIEFIKNLEKELGV